MRTTGKKRRAGSDEIKEDPSAEKKVVRRSNHLEEKGKNEKGRGWKKAAFEKGGGGTAVHPCIKKGTPRFNHDVGDPVRSVSLMRKKGERKYFSRFFSFCGNPRKKEKQSTRLSQERSASCIGTDTKRKGLFLRTEK